MKTFLFAAVSSTILASFELACGGCYAGAEDVRVEGTSCVRAQPSEEIGCGDSIVIVENGCAEALTFNGNSDGGVPRSVTVAAGSTNEVTSSARTRTDGTRVVVEGKVGSTDVVLSWRGVHRTR